MLINCELLQNPNNTDCICQDCIAKHRANGCNYGAWLLCIEDIDDNCDCEEL